MMGPLVLLVRLVVGVVLVSAGVVKLASRQEFAASLRTFGVTNERVRRGVAVLLPWVEIALGAGVVVIPAKWPLTLAAAVLGCFAIALIVTLVKGTNASCGCFGGNGRLEWRHPARTILLVGLSLTAASETAIPLVAGIVVFVLGLVVSNGSNGRQRETAATH